MPPAVFDPLAAVIVHSQVPVNPETFRMIEGEAALLVHSCRRSATRQEWRRYNRDGKLIVFCRHSPVLTYTVRATALDPTGENLGNYHPGRCLSDRALAFLNGGKTPFQFRREVSGVVPGKMILMNPSQEPGAGDATEVDFTVEHAFIDLDVATYPTGGTATPGTGPGLFVSLPAQAAATLTAQAREALVAAVFHGTEPFGTEPLTLTLYAGDPAASGVAISDPLPLEEWIDDAQAPGAPERILLRNHAALEFVDSSALPRTATHLQWARNGIPVARRALAAPITIPAFYGLRVPAGALALSLAWPQHGDMSVPWQTHPAHLALRHLFGLDVLQPAEDQTRIGCFDGDPRAGGVGIPAAGLTVARGVAAWTLSGSTAANATPLVGTAPAPPGGWTIPFVAVGVDGVPAAWVLREFDPPLVVAAGSTLTIPAGALSVTVA